MNVDLLPRRWLLATLLAVALPAAAQYRWTDPTAASTTAMRRPPDAKNLSRIDGRARSEGGDPTGGIPFELRKAMQTFPITLYTAPDCGPCESARAWLRRRGAPYQEIVVDTEVDAEEFKRRVGTTSVPVMTLGRTPHLGFNEGAWSVALSAAGYPTQIVLAADVSARATETDPATRCRRSARPLVRIRRRPRANSTE